VDPHAAFSIDPTFARKGKQPDRDRQLQPRRASPKCPLELLKKTLKIPIRSTHSERVSNTPLRIRVALGPADFLSHTSFSSVSRRQCPSLDCDANVGCGIGRRAFSISSRISEVAAIGSVDRGRRIRFTA
jgi:hypothetical protein